MKLKYYLRGLGIGMIVTALILGISFSNRQDQTSQIMTDDQIRERAAELGMVDSSELTLAALQNSEKQPTEGTPEETTQTQEQNNIESGTGDHGSRRDTGYGGTGDNSGTGGIPRQSLRQRQNRKRRWNRKQQRAGSNRSTTADTDRHHYNKRGSDSGSASRLLYEAGLVENAKAFDNYLCNNGYSRSINPGTYEIAPGTSEEEIAKIITGKH